MDIKNIAVIGAGAMGNGIAHVFALAGYHVALIDMKAEALKRALAAIANNLRRQAAKNIINAADVDPALERIDISSKLERAGSADVVIETVFEELTVKQEVFKALDTFCPSHCVLASNTSSISITEIGSVTTRPQKVVGMHFMNPVPVIKLVEIIRGEATAPTTVALVRELCVKLGKIPVESKDTPGFIANRILMPMINEACYALMEGVAVREDIDTTMKLGMSHPMGPLALADFIGLDVCLAILEVLYKGFGKEKYKPCPLLSQMVQAGKLGKKTGEGFYLYN